MSLFHIRPHVCSDVYGCRISPCESWREFMYDLGFENGHKEQLHSRHSPFPVRQPRAIDSYDPTDAYGRGFADGSAFAIEEFQRCKAARDAMRARSQDRKQRKQSVWARNNERRTLEARANPEQDYAMKRREDELRARGVLVPSY